MHVEMLTTESSRRPGRALRARASTTCTAALPPPTESPLCSKRKIMYVHFSKTSGSVLCYLAKRSGCRRSPTHLPCICPICQPKCRSSSHLDRTHPATIERNCASRSVGFQDGPWWVPTVHNVTNSRDRWIRDGFAIPGPSHASRRYSCAHRLAKAPEFHAVESTLPAGAKLAHTHGGVAL